MPIVGSKWWRVDFHCHSPRSTDYRDPAATPREWLLRCMAVGLDAIVVTDHQSGQWAIDVQAELQRLSEEQPAGYRPLVVFPGVEIMSQNIHWLAIFDPVECQRPSQLLGAARIVGDEGDHDGHVRGSPDDIIDYVRQTQRGIVIPAHVDRPRGLFTEQVAGQIMDDFMANDHLYAMEVVDWGFSDARADSTGWAKVMGSDAHCLSDIGQRSTWVKMSRPDIDGLRLALSDGVQSVRSFDLFPSMNEIPPLVIQSVEIRDAQYCGRVEPLTVSFSPWFTAIVGDRGTGKSSVLEFLRIAMERDLDEDMPTEILETFSKFKRVPANRRDNGALRAETSTATSVRRSDDIYRIIWSNQIREVQTLAGDGTWESLGRQVKSRFRVGVYSQKQIFEMSRHPQALLRVVDQSQGVAKDSWQHQWNQIFNEWSAP